MEANEKCVQSYMPHSVTFMVKSKDALAHEVTVPASSNKKPYVVMTDEEIVALSDDPTFKSMKDQNLIKIMSAIPTRFQDIADTLIKAREENANLKLALSSKDAIIAEKDAKIADLTKIINEDLAEQSTVLSPEKLAALKAKLSTK